MKLNFFGKINILIAFLSCIAFASAYISPQVFWFAGFVSLTIPIFLFINFVLFGVLVFIKPRYSLISLFALVAGFRFIASTCTTHIQSNSPDSFTVLSYNVETFRVYGKRGSDFTEKGKKTIDWLLNSKADILCLQEFYTNSRSKTLNTKEKIKAKGYKYHYFSPALHRRNSDFLGMAIFSKYPIVNGKTVQREDVSNNQIIYADIKLPEGMVRVYNVHLKSMSIKEKELVENDSEEQVKKNIRSVLTKLKKGFIRRGYQIEMLDKELGESKHPVILCGDLNDLPYSYTYYRLQKRLQNAFEKAGNGFGFSFNGRIPFLRIDNQFASSRFKIHSFTTFKDIKYSEHYPLVAKYSFSNNKK